MNDFIAAAKAKGGVSSIPAEEWATTLRKFSVDHEGTWALGPVCGLSNKQAMVGVVLQLMQRTVGANDLHASRTVTLEVEAEALLAARILLRERQGAEILMDDKALELYVKAAKEDGDADGGYRVSLMALKCLNNAIWDQPAGQTAFVRLAGLDMLVGLLKASRPASLLYFSCRILNVVGFSNASAFAELKKSEDLLELLLSVLACCVRCTEPAFPWGECRVKLMVQVLQGLFLLGARFTPKEKEAALAGDTMKRLGFVLVDALHLDHADIEVFNAKLQVLNLLLDMPDSFVQVLLNHGCLTRIVQVVELQLMRQAFQDGGDIDAAAELTPALLVLNNLVQASEGSRVAVKKAIFPPEADQVWRRRLEEEQQELAITTGEAHERAEKAMRDNRVHPVDAPRGSLRARLMKQMTATESSSKTAACDLLYNLCSDEEEFTTRCGFGNVVNTLRLKGRISVPGIG